MSAAEKLQIVRDMRDNGFEAAEIADEIGVSEKWVRAAMDSSFVGFGS